MKLILPSAATLLGLLCHITLASHAGPGAAAQIHLEAENAKLFGTKLSAAAAGYSGRGYVAGFDQKGDAVRWHFAATNGYYRLLLGFRSPYGEKGFEVHINNLTVAGRFPQTDKFSTIDMGLVQLTDGDNTLEVSGGWKISDAWNWYEIDRVDLIPTRPPAPPRPVPNTLCDAQATTETWALMARLAADYGQRTWSGQQSADEIDDIVRLTGRKPVIISGDLMDYTPSRRAYGARPDRQVEELIELTKTGHIASLCWHWGAPTNLLNTPEQPWWRGFYTWATTFDISAALADTNSEPYQLLLQDMDVIAAELKKFSNARVPVLWRPLHESEGGWFWWGAKGPEAFKQLWHLLHQRLTQHHGLHNLIWVLTSEKPEWYPGDDVVDIIGVDAYPDDRSDPLSSRWEPLKARFDGKKLIALTEFGGVPDIEKMHRLGVWFAYFAPWTGNYGPSGMPRAFTEYVYQSPNVFTLDGAKPR